MRLDVRDIRAGYGKLEVLHSLSIEAQAGECVAVIGPNGAGKTTLLNTIVGRIEPRAGSVRFNGEALTNQPVHERVRLGIGLVSEGRNLFPTLAVKENLLLADQMRATDAEDGHVDRILDLFPALRQRWNLPAGRLSGGEQQMVAIARALMLSPSLLMLDEPSTGLAPRVVREVMDVARSLLSESVGLLLVEQNAQEVARVADRVYLLEGGLVRREGPPAQMLDPEQLRRDYLGA